MALIKDIEVGDVLYLEADKACRITFAVLKKTGRKARLLIDSEQSIQVTTGSVQDFKLEDRAVSAG